MNLVVQSFSWETNSYSANLKIPQILWKPKVHYKIHNSPPPDPILSQVSTSVHSNPTSWSSILILSYLLHLDFEVVLSFRSPHQTTVRTSPASYTCHMPRPNHSSWFDRPNYIRWGVQIIKLFVKYFSLPLCHLLLLRPKYLPQHSIL